VARLAMPMEGAIRVHSPDASSSVSARQPGCVLGSTLVEGARRGQPVAAPAGLTGRSVRAHVAPEFSGDSAGSQITEAVRAGGRAGGH
jgi:hypothetical protein